MTEEQFAAIVDPHVGQMGNVPEGFVEVRAESVQDRDAFEQRLGPDDFLFREPVSPQPMGRTLPDSEIYRIRWPR